MSLLCSSSPQVDERRHCWALRSFLKDAQDAGALCKCVKSEVLNQGKFYTLRTLAVIADTV
jgi:hypothetical protein